MEHRIIRARSHAALEPAVDLARPDADGDTAAARGAQLTGRDRALDRPLGDARALRRLALREPDDLRSLTLTAPLPAPISPSGP